MFSWTVCPSRREYRRRCETLLPVAPVLGIRRSVAPGFCDAIFLDPQPKKAPNCRGSDEKDPPEVYAKEREEMRRKDRRRVVENQVQRH